MQVNEQEVKLLTHLYRRLLPVDARSDAEGNWVDVVPQPEQLERLRLALDRLPERERRIISMRWGLGEFIGEQHTLPEVADKEGITHERVAQIEQKTLTRLRHPEGPLGDPNNV